MIYFIESECGEKIKIGFTERRLNELRTNCGDIKLLGEIPGGMGLERDLHSIYEKDRLHGEWFYATITLRNHITRLMGVTAPKIIGYTRPSIGFASTPIYDTEPDPVRRAEAAKNPRQYVPGQCKSTGWPNLRLTRRKQ